MKWFISLRSSQEEAEWLLGEFWLHWGFPAETTSSDDRLYRQLLDELLSFLLTSILQVLVLESGEVLLS